MNLRLSNNTTFIDITVTDENPVGASKIANTIAETYRKFRLEQRQQRQQKVATSEARTRRFAKNLGEASPQFHTLGAPPNGPLWSSLVVPVQPSLEKIARQRIESGDRVEGAKALRYFKSASNIKLLKPFLNDPGSVTRAADKF